MTSSNQGREIVEGWLWPVAFCLAGLMVAQHQVVFSGFQVIQADVVDARFHHYVLEHSWRWISGHPGHPDFWNAGFFYPAQNQLAYSDPMLGVAPMYWIWRLFRISTATSFQLWVLLLGGLNFGSAYLVLRRGLGGQSFAASVGAALFAFASCRMTQAAHPQLFAQFWSMGSLYALLRLFEPGSSRSIRSRSIWLFTACAVLQLWGGFYQGWFLGLSLLVALGWSLGSSSRRRCVVEVLRAHRVQVPLATLACAAALAPMAIQFLSASQQVGLRSFEEIRSMLPRPWAWLYQGPGSWLYGFLATHPPFRDIPVEHEQRLGFGWLTTLVALSGLALGWRRGPVRLILLTGLSLFGLSLFVFDHSAWSWIYQAVPGAKAIRAVSRVGLILLVPISIAVWLRIAWLAQRGRAGMVAALLLAAVILVEQGQTTQAYEKGTVQAGVAAIVNAIPPGCEAFLFSPLQGYAPDLQYDLDAMWAQLESGVPTLNGYSGKTPPGWNLSPTNLRPENPEAQVQRNLEVWIRLHALDPAHLCWVRLGLQEGPYRAEFVSQEVPAVLQPRESALITVAFRNTGQTSWLAAEEFRLGWAGPTEDHLWGVHRVNLPGPVAPGEVVRFQFRVTAPSQAGSWPFRWRMVRDHVRWFGELSPETQVRTRAPLERAPP